MRARELARPLAGKAIAAAAVLCALLGARWIAFSAQDFGTPPASARSTGHDALWLSHRWVGADSGPAAVDALAATVRASGIRDLFVHVGPLNDDGTLDPALRPRARWFAAAVHGSLPGVRLQAWIGDAPAPAGGMDLQDPATRARIGGSATGVLADGFDGVHLDFEPVGDADPGYLALLDALAPPVHAAGRILSVSAEQVEPLPGTRWALEAVVRHGTWWSGTYLARVASRVDQVAIMSYDTVLWSASAYTGFVRDETRAAIAAVPPSTALLIGAPAFHTHDLRHDDSAETVDAAVRGIRLALPGGTPTGRDFGVALYLDYYATRADWGAYRSDWLSPAAP